MNNQPIPFTCYRIAGEIYPDGSFTWGPGRAMTIDEASLFLRKAVESALLASSRGHDTMSTDMKTAAETRQDARIGLDQQRQQALSNALYNIRVNASFGHTWIFGRVQHARYVMDNLRVLGYRVTRLGFGYIVVRW